MITIIVQDMVFWKLIRWATNEAQNSSYNHTISSMTAQEMMTGLLWNVRLLLSPCQYMSGIFQRSVKFEPWAFYQILSGLSSIYFTASTTFKFMWLIPEHDTRVMPVFPMLSKTRPTPLLRRADKCHERWCASFMHTINVGFLYAA